ncbi:hypothetical protein BLA29_013281 [Euroglyphus maynei]|uniref:Uncharacterized protein n=1 Tax=Euroglyphus maynei TaxID=6958 RepID=A0A1Y3BT32_EURMA|nr:hypothetical protein BLA29_013281 [Euroglyphus maynei]
MISKHMMVNHIANFILVNCFCPNVLHAKNQLLIKSCQHLEKHGIQNVLLAFNVVYHWI